MYFCFLKIIKQSFLIMCPTLSDCGYLMNGCIALHTEIIIFLPLYAYEMCTRPCVYAEKHSEKIPIDNATIDFFLIQRIKWQPDQQCSIVHKMLSTSEFRFRINTL